MRTKIYIADCDLLTDKALFDELYSSVKRKRQQKIDKLRFDEDKRLSLGVELLLKNALNDCGIDYANARFVYGENGKPYLENNEVFFSLSHSGTLAVCAVSSREIGVDIEQICRADYKISKRIFTEKEQAFAGNSAQKFIRLWTLKESYMKYCGSGLTIAPRDIEIEFDNNIPHFKGLDFFEYELNGCRLALCGDTSAEIEYIEF